MNNRRRLTNLNLSIELRNDSQRISDWHEEHPFGPITQIDKEELAELIEQKIGSYILIQIENGRPIDAKYIEFLREPVEDWMV
jgi:hypothetical protein